MPAAVTFVVAPSPKSQNQFVTEPDERSVKVTRDGFEPLSGLATKSATGANVETPVTPFVLPPAPAVLKIITLLKLPDLIGLKRTMTFVEPKPGTLKGVPETMAKGPPT